MGGVCNSIHRPDPAPRAQRGPNGPAAGTTTVSSENTNPRASAVRGTGNGGEVAPTTGTDLRGKGVGTPIVSYLLT